MKIRNIWN